MKKREHLFIFIILLSSVFLVGNASAGIEEWFKGIIGLSPESSELSLISHYKFENNLYDSEGRNHGINNGATFTTGIEGSALNFDGNDHVSIAGTPIAIKRPFTISFWAKSSDNGDIQIYSEGNAQTNTPVFLIGKLNGKPRVSYSDDANKQVNINSDLVLDEWGFYTFVSRSDSDHEFYVNAVSQGTSTISLSTTTLNRRTIGALGRAVRERFWNGSIDEVKIYDRALTHSEIIDSYQHSIKPIDLDCTDFGYNEGQVGACCDLQCTKYDLSSCKNSTITCTDNDNGINYFSASNVSIGSSTVYGPTCSDIPPIAGGGGGIFKDRCEENLLKEYFCQANNEEGFVKYECPEGCTDGACKSKTPIPINMDACLDNPNYYWDQETDKCYAGFSEELISSSCSDPDGGLNKGIAAHTFGFRYSFADSRDQRIRTGGKDACMDDKTVREHYCDNKGFIQVADLACSNGCNDGTCIGETSCIDSDYLIEQKEIMEGKEDNIAGLNIRVNEAGETNLALHVDLRIVLIRSNEPAIDISLTDKNSKAEVKFGDAIFLIELISVTDISATIRVENNGHNYWTKGEAKNSTFSETDLCLVQGGAFNTIIESYCENGAVKSESYECPFGCGKKDDALYGACKKALNPGECKPLLDKLSEKNEIYEGFIKTAKDTDDDPEESPYWNGRAKIQSYTFQNKEENKGILIATVILEEGVLAKDAPWFDSLKTYSLLGGDIIPANKGGERVYVIYDKIGNGIIMLWVNKNVIVYMFIYGLEFEKNNIKSIDDLINSLQDNKFESIIDYSNPDYRILSRIAYELLTSCPSEIDASECIPRWERKVEPSVCPPHGYQKIIIKDSNRCIAEIKETTQGCSPGICSGCYVPRWLGFDSRGDNICIPYTTRLANERSEQERLYADDREPEIKLTCLSETEAELIIYEIGGADGEEGKKEIISYKLHESESYLLPQEFGNIRFRVDNLECEENKRQYIDVSVIESFDAYCDIDGNIKRQLTKEASGDWAKCQNNYECNSNLCSGGECVELNDIITQAKGFKSVFVRVICRVAHIFSEDNYNRCVGEYLGYSPIQD